MKQMNVHMKLAKFLHPLRYRFIKLLAGLTNKKPHPNLCLPNDACHRAQTRQQNGQQYRGSSCDESRYHTYRIHNEIENQDLSNKTLTTKASLTLRSTVQLTDM
jgi:hypothetical protein